MYEKWTDIEVSLCLCYCQSLSLAWTNTLAYNIIRTLRISNDLWDKPPAVNYSKKVYKIVA
jgi:hypothetical protein